MKFLILIFVVFLSCVVYGGTIDPNTPDSEYIKYGNEHECVLPIMGILDDKLNSNFRGSCVIISPYYCISAAHVVSNSICQHIIYDNKVYPCAIVAIHGLYNPNIKGTNDIALIKLQKPINLDFYPELYTEKDEINKICSIAGYGFSGNFKTGYNVSTYDNKKRAGSNIINHIDKNTLICSVTDKPNTTLEFMIASGDSGGGLFIDQKLAGINSCVYATDGKANSDYGDESAHTRISDYITWIDDTKKLIEKITEN